MKPLEFKPSKLRPILLSLAITLWNLAFLLFIFSGEPYRQAVIPVVSYAFAFGGLYYWYCHSYTIKIDPSSLEYKAPHRRLRTYRFDKITNIAFEEIRKAPPIGRGSLIKNVIYLDRDYKEYVDVTTFDLPTLRRLFSEMAEVNPAVTGYCNDKAWAIMRGRLRHTHRMKMDVLIAVFGTVALISLPFLLRVYLT